MPDLAKFSLQYSRDGNGRGRQRGRAVPVHLSRYREILSEGRGVPSAAAIWRPPLLSLPSQSNRLPEIEQHLRVSGTPATLAHPHL